MKPSTQVKILGVEVEAEYHGSVYEWTINVEADDTIIDCFQGKSHVTRDDVGGNVDLILMARMTGGSVRPTSGSKGIEQPEEVDSDLSKWHSTIKGEVLDTDVPSEELPADDWSVYLVDVGIGTVIVERDDQFQELLDTNTVNEGSTIEVDCSRIDIVGRYD